VFVTSVISYQIDHTLSFIDQHKSPLHQIVWLIVSSKKVVLLVILYAVANILAYYALARVDAAVYTVLLQVRRESFFFFIFCVVVC
jgi:6-phosphogluconolactonase (cycloisomerase 2 family)